MSIITDSFTSRENPPACYGSPPNTLRPEYAEAMFPTPGVGDLQELKKAGWVRFGIVAAILNTEGDILLLEHTRSSKNPDGALGPLAETAQLYNANGTWEVETITQTLHRAFREELGAQRPEDLDLRARRIGAWAINDWPVSGRHEDRTAFAICPVVQVSDETAARLEGFCRTAEIKVARFVDPEEIPHLSNLRPGTIPWLQSIIVEGLLYSSAQACASVDFRQIKSSPNGRDANLKELAL